MKRIINKLGFSETLILLVYLVVLNNILGKVETTITADGIGYYDYLPSIFVYDDLKRNNADLIVDSLKYARIKNIGAYELVDDKMVNIYPIGTALLQSPFFLITYLQTSYSNTFESIYQKSFQNSVFYAALFYLLLGLIFLRKTLIIYKINNWIIFIVQFLILFATSLTYYSHAESAFSHVYSFFAISAFIFYSKSYFTKLKNKDFLLAAAFLGLILIIRQINILSILFLPFIAGSWQGLKLGLVKIFKNYKLLTLAIIIVLSIFGIQSSVWYLQTGNWLINSYQNYSFNWFNPQIFNILFSFKKGLFIYTPILVFSLFSLMWYIKRKLYFEATSWSIAFIIITYLLSSWFSWFYGCSYGLRAYIDYYVYFFIPITIFINNISKKWQITTVGILISFIPINLIQTYQYQNYILHWINMDSKKYKTVFLKTDDQYKGLLWKKQFDDSQFSIIQEYKTESLTIREKAVCKLFSIKSSEIINYQDLKLIKIEFENDFNEQNLAKINFSINGSTVDKNYQSFDVYINHFQEIGFNRKQKGVYYFEISPQSDTEDKTINFEIVTLNDSTILNNIHISLLK